MRTAWQKYRYGPRTLRILHFLLAKNFTLGQIALRVRVSRQRVHEIKRLYLPRHAK
jgi:hypothetical protein